MGNNHNVEALLRKWKETYWHTCSETTKGQYVSIQKAIKLTDQIEKYEGVLKRKPVRKIAQPEYPEIQSRVKFSWPVVFIPLCVLLLLAPLSSLLTIWLFQYGIFLYLGLFFPLLFIGWPVFYYFVLYKPKKEVDIQRQRGSPQYRARCAEIDAKVQRKQAELDEAYQKKLQQYNSAVYELAMAKRALTEHYAMTQVVPARYRHREALLYISVFLLMKNDLQDAIDAYEETQESQTITCEESSVEHHRSPGVLNYLLRQGVDHVTIQRNAGRAGKRDLIGQTGCARNYGGDCSDCNVRSGCARYFF